MGDSSARPRAALDPLDWVAAQAVHEAAIAAGI